MFTGKGTFLVDEHLLDTLDDAIDSEGFLIDRGGQRIVNVNMRIRLLRRALASGLSSGMLRSRRGWVLFGS